MRGPGGPGGFMGGGGLVGLMRNPQVQEELKLSDGQKEDLRELGEKLREEMRDAFPDRESLQDLSEDERRARFQEAMEKVRKEAEKRAPEVEKKIAEILEPSQFKRLKQVDLQRRGIDALVDPAIIKALEISDDQQKQIKDAIAKRDEKRQELGEEMRGIFQGGFRDMSEEEREKAREKMQQIGEKRRAIDAEAQKSAMGALTADQKAKLPELMGEPFEFRRPEGPPGRGRPGEGRRGRGRRGGGPRGDQ